MSVVSTVFGKVSNDFRIYFNLSYQKIRSDACSIHPALQGWHTFSSAQRTFKLHWGGKEVEILQLKILQRNKVGKNIWNTVWVKS